MCKLLCFVQTASYACSILILTIISLERYLVISHPLQTRRYTQRRLLRASIVSCVWAASALYAAPLLFVYDTVLGDPDELFCLRSHSILNVTTFYVMVDFVLLYALPLLLMSAVYAKIAIVLWRSSSKSAQRQVYRVSGPRNRGPDVTATAVWSFRRSRTSRGGSLRAPTWMLASGVDDNGVARVQKSMLVDPTVEDQDKMEDCSSNLRGRCSTVSDQVAATAMDLETKTGRGGVRRSCCIANSSTSSGSSGNNYGQKTRLDSIGEGVETNCVSSISDGIRMSDIPTTKGIAAASGVQGSTTSQLNKNPLAHRRKVIRLLMAMVVSFAVCMLPHHVRLQWQEWSQSEEFDYRHMFLPPMTTLIFFFNSALNPFLYALISDRFRQSVMEIDWFMIRRIRELFRKRHQGLNRS